jgi:hypothetical protein
MINKVEKVGISIVLINVVAGIYLYNFSEGLSYLGFYIISYLLLKTYFDKLCEVLLSFVMDSIKDSDEFPELNIEKSNEFGKKFKQIIYSELYKPFMLYSRNYTAYLFIIILIFDIFNIIYQGGSFLFILKYFGLGVSDDPQV